MAREVRKKVARAAQALANLLGLDRLGHLGLGLLGTGHANTLVTWHRSRCSPVGTQQHSREHVSVHARLDSSHLGYAQSVLKCKTPCRHRYLTYQPEIQPGHTASLQHPPRRGGRKVVRAAFSIITHTLALRGPSLGTQDRFTIPTHL